MQSRLGDKLLKMEHSEPPENRKKGVINSDKYMKNVIKNARISGQEYVSYKGNTVPAKTAGEPCR